MTELNPKVEAFLGREQRWRAEFEALRAMVLASGLREDFKWGKPCYTLDGNNVVLMHGFKEYCALLFFKGALLKDEENLLIQQTDNVQAARQIRLTSEAEIVGKDNLLKAYLQEAIDVEKSGRTVEFKKTAEFAIPEEFRRRLETRPDLKAAFETLTPGRQRAYLLHFSRAKQAKTREARIEKYLPQILAGKGLDD